MPEQCAYCQTNLISGKYGNKVICLICKQHVCKECSKYGICNHDLKQIEPNTVQALASLNKKYLTLVISLVFLTLIISIFVMIYYALFEKVFQILLSSVAFVILMAFGASQVSKWFIEQRTEILKLYIQPSDY